MNGPLTLAFPAPETPALRKAFLNLYLASADDEATKKAIGNPAHLPRPWDPASCTDPALRAELWDWLEQVVIWLNHEYVWDPNAGMIPTCWPQHAHLVHEIAVLADQRRRASIDTTSSTLEEWHRYCLPAFLDRLKARTKQGCDEQHGRWPAASRFERADRGAGVREGRFRGDLASLTNVSNPAPQDETWARRHELIDPDTGHRIDPTTGELL